MKNELNEAVYLFTNDWGRSLKKIFLAVLFLLSVSGVAHALSYTVTDVTTFSATGTGEDPSDLDGAGGDYVNELEGTGDFVVWTHQYEFDPEVVSITSATLTLSLRDDGGKYDCFEFAFGWTESGEWAWGEVDTGEYAYDLSLGGLEDGFYQVTLVSLFGDFFIDSSELVINYEGVAPVPEPATMLLLGTGLIGMAGMSRKKMSK